MSYDKENLEESFYIIKDLNSSLKLIKVYSNEYWHTDTFPYVNMCLWEIQQRWIKISRSDYLKLF